MSNTGKMETLIEDFGCLILLPEESDTECVMQPQCRITMHKLNELRVQGQFCDVKLIAGAEEKCILGHRLILKVSSDYFLAMFTNGLSETHQSEINLRNFKSNIVELIVQYCYGQKIVVDNSNVVDLLIVASHMQFHYLVFFCSNYLIQHMDEKNCLGIYRFAWQHDLTKLSVASLNYIVNNITRVMDQEEIRYLLLHQITEIISRDDLNVDQEEQAFQLLCIWLHHDIKNRIICFVEMLKYLKLSLVSPSLIEEYLEPILNDLSDKDTAMELQSIIMYAYKSYTFSGRLKVTPRISRGNVPQKIWAVCSGTSNLVIVQFEVRHNTWVYYTKTIGIQAKLFSNFDIVMHKDMMYFIGGSWDKCAVVNMMKCMDIQTKEMSDCPHMEKCRVNHCAAELRGFIYSIGGEDENSVVLSSVEQFDLNQQTWKFVASLNIARSKASVVSLANRLYVFGGYDESFNLVSIIECYDPDRDKWDLFSVCDGSSRLLPIELEDEIFLVNKSSINNVEKFDHCTLKKDSKVVHDTLANFSIATYYDSIFVMNRNFPKNVSRCCFLDEDSCNLELNLKSCYHYGILKTVYRADLT